MVILHVHVHVRPEHLDAFREATLENARNSIQEPGVLRFDVVQQVDDPARFVIVEVYRDESAIEAHRQSAHYAKWRDLAEPMMAEPRHRALFKTVFPDEEDW